VNLLAQLLIAALLIAVMAGARLISDRRVLKHRKRCGHQSGPGCSHGCKDKEAETETGGGGCR
jgi:hypothetical protein